MMPDQTKPRETFRDAFNTVLTSEFDETGDPPIVEYLDPTAAQQHSIVLQIVSGTNARPSLGRRVAATQKGMKQTYRIQISIHNPDGCEAAEKEADRVEEAITSSLETPLRSTYGVFDVKKLVDTDQGPTDPGERMAHVIMDYQGSILATNRLKVLLLMPSWSCQIVTDTVTPKLAAFAAKLEREVQMGLDVAGADMEDLAKSLVPVRTGYLRSTIYHRATGYVLNFGAGANYASYIEFGTWKMAARPYLRPALHASMQRLVDEIRTSVMNTLGVD